MKQSSKEQDWKIIEAINLKKGDRVIKNHVKYFEIEILMRTRKNNSAKVWNKDIWMYKNNQLACWIDTDELRLIERYIGRDWNRQIDT